MATIITPIIMDKFSDINNFEKLKLLDMNTDNKLNFAQTSNTSPFKFPFRTF